VKIPRKHVFPGGFTVKIEQLEREDFKAENGADEACFDRDNMTILLDRGRSKADRKADFIHEMGHAFLDWQYWYERNG